MVRRFDKIGPKIDQMWAWMSRGATVSPGVRNPLKSSVTGHGQLLSRNQVSQKIRATPPPPPPPLKQMEHQYRDQLNNSSCSLSDLVYVICAIRSIRQSPKFKLSDLVIGDMTVKARDLTDRTTLRVAAEIDIPVFFNYPIAI